MAIVLHNSGSQGSNSLTNGGEVTTLALKIRAVPDRYLVFSVAFRSNTSSVTNVRWQPAGTTTGEEALTFLGAFNHPTQALRVEQWGLLNPSPSSAATSRVVWVPSVSVSSRAAYAATCYQGVHQTTPYAGYPSTPTNFQTDAGATLTSPSAGETTGITITTVAGDMVVDVFGSDAATNTNNFNTTTGGLIPNARTLLSNPIGDGIRFGTAQLTATGTSTSMKWKSYGGGVTSFGSGQSGRQYVHAGFSLQPSLSVAPYWVRPPNEVVAVGATTASGVRFNSLSDWPTAGSIQLAQTVGPTEWGTTISLLTKQFTAHTATAITGASTYAGSMTMGDTAMYAMIAGDSGAQLGTGTIILYVPGTAAADDVILIDVYTEGATVSAATFASAGSPTATQIAAQTTGGFTHTLLYKRLTAADITASSITITFSATPSWRAAAAQIYRGCTTSGDPYVTAGDGAPTTNSGTGTTLTITGVTTPSADHTVYFSAAKFDGNVTWTLPNASNSLAERTRWFNLWQGERPMTTAGATGNQAITINSTPWSAMAITLIPNSTSSTNFTRPTGGDVVAVSVTGTRTAARKVNPYYRITPAIGISGTRAVARKANPYKRAASNSAISITISVTRKLIRTRSRVISISGTRSVARKANPYKRSPQRLGSVTITITHVPPAGPTTYIRPAVGDVLRVNVSGTRSVSRKANPYKRSASRTTTITLTLVRRGNPAKRAAAMSRSGTRSVTRKANPYARGLSRVGTVSLSLAGSTVGAITWFDYTPPSGQPIILKINDVGTTYPGCTFRLEVQMRNTILSSKGYARLWNIDAGTPVPNSQVETSAPHTTSQIVRSVPITIASNTRYKAQFGRTAGSLVEPSYARVGVRSVP